MLFPYQTWKGSLGKLLHTKNEKDLFEPQSANLALPAKVWSSLSFQEPFKHNLSQKYPIKLGLIWALGSKSVLDNWFVLA